MKFIYYPKCSTCIKALKTLEKKYNNIELVDIKQNTPTANELQQLHEKSGLAIKNFFNTSGLKYKEMNLKDKLDQYRLQEKYTLLASDGMLIKRPILIIGDDIIVGTKHPIYNEE